MEKDILLWDNDPYAPENHVYRVKEFYSRGKANIRMLRLLS